MADVLTILIAEDEESLLNLYRDWLTSEGFTIRKAADGEEALQKWDRDVDLAILDRRMPGMSGGEVLRAVREQGYHTPVSMLTAVAPDVDVIGMEFDDYITKPVTKDKLIDVVDRLTRIASIRTTVRDFVRTGVILHQLQNEHGTEELRTHAEYQQLKQEYKQLHQDVTDALSDLTTYEKRLLLHARKQL